MHCKVKEPTAWVNSMHVVYKPGKTRVYLDPRDLNQYIMREHYPMQLWKRLTHVCREKLYLVALTRAVGTGKYHYTRKAPILLHTIPLLEGIGTCACLLGYPQQEKSGSPT